MDFIYVGKVVNTHGIKGEVRIISSFEKKELVFKEGFALYFGTQKIKEVINSYRVHKSYDMVTLKGISDINEVLKYKGVKVYINREDLHLSNKDFLLEDLIGCKVICENKLYGKVLDVINNKAGILLEVSGDKTFYIPYVEDFVKEVKVASKEIMVLRIEELL